MSLAYLVSISNSSSEYCGEWDVDSPASSDTLPSRGNNLVKNQFNNSKNLPPFGPMFCTLSLSLSAYFQVTPQIIPPCCCCCWVSEWLCPAPTPLIVMRARPWVTPSLIRSWGGGVLNKELINNVNWGKPGHGGFRFRFCYQRANFPPQLSLSPKLGNLLKCKS